MPLIARLIFYPAIGVFCFACFAEIFPPGLIIVPSFALGYLLSKDLNH